MSNSTAAASSSPEGQVWTKDILPTHGWFHIPWRELWAYRDLIVLFAMRDISASYKQTILGPLWFVIQPLLATVFFSFLFGRMAKMGTDNLPHFLFYFSGFILWQFFSECVNKTSNTFTRNAHLFGKVYFPRLAMPLSSVVTGLVTFSAAVPVNSTTVRWPARTVTCTGCDPRYGLSGAERTIQVPSQLSGDPDLAGDPAVALPVRDLSG